MATSCSWNNSLSHRLLREAGPDVRPVLLNVTRPETIPEDIVLQDEKMFAGAFPELAHRFR